MEYSVRVILGVLSFFMFFVSELIKSSLYITIIAINQSIDEIKIYHGIILGAFYASYWMTELPGAFLAQKFGSRIVLGIFVPLAGLSSTVFPVLTKINPFFAVVLRAIQGLALGATWPALHSLSAKWIPKTERSKFMICHHGSAIGSAFTFPFCGLIISSYGWEWVFYSTGIFTFVWTVGWWFLVHDSPNTHPFILEKERVYLEENIQGIDKEIGFKQTPWKQILRSGPFWALVCATQGVMWTVITLAMQMPLYFHQVHNLDIKMSGFLLGLPNLAKFLFGFTFSILMDLLLKHQKMSITGIRKFAVTVSILFPSIMIVILGYFGQESHIVAITIAILMIALTGANSAGNLANVVDLTPNFAGVILGLIKTIGFIPGVISPLAVSWIVKDKNRSSHNWFNVFLLSAFIMFSAWLIYMLFGSGEIQSWNKKSEKKRIEENLEDEVKNLLSVELQQKV